MSVSPETAHELVTDLHLLGRVMRGALVTPEEGQLHPGGLGVLLALAARGHCRQNELAADLCISQSALSRQITELVGAGLASRQADPEDGRASQILATDAGLELLVSRRASVARELQVVLADWSETDARSARDTIRKLKQSLTRHAHRAATPEYPSSCNESQEVHV